MLTFTEYWLSGRNGTVAHIVTEKGPLCGQFIHRDGRMVRQRDHRVCSRCEARKVLDEAGG